MDSLARKKLSAAPIPVPTEVSWGLLARKAKKSIYGLHVPLGSLIIDKK